LDGESFNGVPTFSNEACNPQGTSSFNYSVSGDASGPYAGAFLETGTVTVGPQTVPQEYTVPLGTLTGTLTVKTGAVATLEATFTIQSPQGVITGTKTLVTGASGACEDTGQLNGFLLNQTVPVLLRGASGDLSYSAPIPTSKKTYCDTGTSTLNMGEFIAGTLGTLQAPSFTESFASGSVAPLHGQQSC
jgi:hypothetical protein